MKYYEIDFVINGPIDSIQDTRDLIAALSCEAGLETFEDTEKGIKGYVQQSLFDKDILNTVLNDFPISDAKITYTVNEAEDKDWNEEWENEGFEPIIIDNRCVIHDGRHLPQEDYAINVEIDAKMAFGTGTHETTRMVVSELIDLQLKDKSILDCGCGTGILGIVALQIGASEVLGYDIDEWSTNNAVHNAIINMVDNRYQALLGDSSVLDTVNKKFDVVVANINRNILLADMPQFKKMMSVGSVLILSGFYIEDTEIIIDCAKELGFENQSIKTDNNWTCLKFVLTT